MAVELLKAAMDFSDGMVKARLKDNHNKISVPNPIDEEMIIVAGLDACINRLKKLIKDKDEQ